MVLLTSRKRQLYKSFLQRNKYLLINLCSIFLMYDKSLTGGVISLVVLELRDRGDDLSDGEGLALAEWIPLLRPPDPLSV